MDGTLRVKATDYGDDKGLRLVLTVDGVDRMRACIWEKDDGTFEGFRGDFAANKVWQDAPPMAGGDIMDRLEDFNQGTGTLAELLEVFTR